jgi:ribosome biogenesis protein YTM1
MKLGSHKNWVSSIANSPKSEYGLASGSYDATVKVWDIRSSIPLHTMSNDDAKVFAVDWKNQFIVSGGEDSKVHVFSTSQ